MSTVMDPKSPRSGPIRAIERDRRRELIAAAISTIATQGLSKTTVAKVAAEAGLSPGIVSFYFDSKDELLLSTLLHLTEEYDKAIARAVVDGDDAPQAKLARIVSTQFTEALCDAHRVAVWTAFWGETQARTEYQKLCGKSDDANFNVVLELCRQLAAASRTPVHAEAVARALEGIIEGLWQELLADPRQFDRARAEQLCLAYLASVFPDHFSMPVEESKAEPACTEVLAPWTYFDQDLFEAEKEMLFKRNWLLAGHVSDAPDVGDFFTYDAVDERALIVRGDDGEIRAFHNVCRHRGSRVVAEDRGNCPRAIICPFHGWAYNLSGDLQGIPQSGSFPNLDQSKIGLVKLDCEIWHGFIFIRFGGHGVSVKEMLAPIERQLLPYRIEDMKPLGARDFFKIGVNWKSLHDIDNEGYHVPVGHPALNALLNDYHDDFYPHNVVTSTGTMSEETAANWSVARYQKLLPRFDHLPETSQRRWFYWGMFPNLSFEVMPERIGFYQTIPLAVDETLMVSACYGLDDDRREVRAVRYLNSRINDRVAKEDYELVKWSYEAMRSSQFPRNRLSELEYGVLAFHNAIREQIPAAAKQQPPRSAS